MSASIVRRDRSWVWVPIALLLGVAGIVTTFAVLVGTGTIPRPTPAPWFPFFGFWIFFGFFALFWGGPLAPVAMGMGLPLGVQPRVLAGQRRGRHREGEVRPGRDHEGAVRSATSGPERV